MPKQNINLISPHASEMLRERLAEFVSNEFATVMGNKQWGYFSTGFVSFGDQYRSLRNRLSKQEQRVWSSDLSGRSKSAKRFTESHLREITDKRDERLFWLGYLEVNFQAERVYRNHYRDRLAALWDIIKAKEPWRSYKIRRDDRLVYDDAEVDIRYLADAHQLGRKVVPNQGEFAFYRGTENAQWNQLPAVLRSDRLYEVEHELLQELRLYYPAEFPNSAATVDWLARAQHFGLPTRLGMATMEKSA